jgi:hypothetical protein
MHYYYATILLHIIGAIVGLVLIRPRRVVARPYNLGKPRTVSLRESVGKTRWEIVTAPDHE